MEGVILRETMKVKIKEKKALLGGIWYEHHIGETFKVYKDEIIIHSINGILTGYRLVEYPELFIYSKDCFEVGVNSGQNMFSRQV